VEETKAHGQEAHSDTLVEAEEGGSGKRGICRTEILKASWL